MKIIIEDEKGRTEFEVPEWARERKLTILAGVESLATKMPWEDFWLIKNDRCAMCGQCCMMFKPDTMQTPYGIDDEGKCKALIREGDKWECGARIRRPYNCLADPSLDEVPECSITHHKVKAEK